MSKIQVNIKLSDITKTKKQEFYSRVPNTTVGLNKSEGGKFSWKLIKM